MLVIITCSVEDLPRMEGAAMKFYGSSKKLGEHAFKIDMFVALWTQLISNGTGVIFGLEDNGKIVGALGGIKYPDIYSGDLLASEFFWFVEEEQRGMGLKLYFKFEEWAREQGCVQIRMGHMVDLMPERLIRIYTRLGFTPIETHYGKALVHEGLGT